MAFPKSLSILHLMGNVKANLKRYRTDQAQKTKPRDSTKYRRPSPNTLRKMTSDAEDPDYTTRTVDQEIDTVVICPSHDDFMIVGTYSLVKQEEDAEYVGQSRKGSLQIMTINPGFEPRYAGMLPPTLDRIYLPCAVLDIHFHPLDDTLLGAVTSNGRMYLFRFIVHGDVLGRRVTTKLLELANLKVAENDEFGLTPLITQFTWLHSIKTHGIKDVDDMMEVEFAATTTFGDVRLVKLSLPAIKGLSDERAHYHDRPLESKTNYIVHKHDLEAWTLAVLELPMLTCNPDCLNRLFFSGADDSALIASKTKFSYVDDPFSEGGTFTVTSCWKDRTHGAGVVAILPLAPVPDSEVIPLLTGSYDEYLRIFELDPLNYRRTWKTDHHFSGGVWRLQVLDQYTTPAEPQPQQHYLILASLMHAGASIIRITYTASPTDPDTGTWTITPEKTFTAGHSSMVYACAARLDSPSPSPPSSRNSTAFPQANPGYYFSPTEQFVAKAVTTTEKPEWTIISTSFYDMKVCTWKFVDEIKGGPSWQS